MNKVFIIIIILGTYFCSNNNQENKTASTEDTESLQTVDGYKFYGEEKVILENKIDMNSFLTKLNGGDTNFVLEGNINSVCQKAGCWITMKINDSTEMFVKFANHFTIPTATDSGQNVIVQGIAKWDTTTIEEQKHYIEDELASEDISAEKRKELEKEKSEVVKDKFELRMKATAILVKE